MPWWLFNHLSERAFVRLSALKKVLDGIPLNVGYDGPGPILPTPVTSGGMR